MELIVAALIAVWLVFHLVYLSIRSGTTPIYHMSATRSERPLLYWFSVLSLLYGLGLALNLLVSLSIHAYQGTAQFQDRGLWPVTQNQLQMAAVDVIVLLVVAYFTWRHIQIRRLLNEYDDNEPDGA